jgi:threonine synthase
MKYYSTNNKNLKVTFREAVLKGLADDGGLFMPESIYPLSKNILSDLNKFSFREISYTIAQNFIDDEIEKSELEKIINESINFEAPLVKLTENISVLELFHGPTLAFKDFGARFMAKVFSYLNRNNDKQLIILVATSGDTGSAVANGFYECDGIKVVILFPSGKVSEVQEKQLISLGKNISALEVDGTFDDCQRLVKKAFIDKELNGKVQLSSANSINIARLIPQTFYYINAIRQLENQKMKIIFSVPSGNFGNLTAGLFAKRMGLHVEKFIAALNSNKVFYDYLQSGSLTPRPSIRTYSNAMDVGNPSNFARIIDLYQNNYNMIREDIYSKFFDDKETVEAMREVYEKYNYVIDPHGAVGYLAVKEFINDFGNDFNFMILETAHPAKFADVAEKKLDIRIEMPERLSKYLSGTSSSVKIPSDYNTLKEFLISM